MPKQTPSTAYQDKNIPLSAVRLVLSECLSILRKDFLFHLCFVAALIAETTYFLVHLTLFADSFLVAIHLGLITMTLFCYLTLRLTLYNWRQDALNQIEKQFISTIHQQVEMTDQDLALVTSKACCEVANAASHLPVQVIPISWARLHQWLATAFQPAICSLKERFFHRAIRVILESIKSHPMDLEKHAVLGNQYVLLAEFYKEREKSHPIQFLSSFIGHPIPNKSELDKQFKQSMRLAIEEFLMLQDSTPRDPWIHLQLAYCYEDLNKKEQALEAYQTLHTLCPHDLEFLFRLGRLFFALGHHRKGLEVYQQMKNTCRSRAEELLTTYVQSEMNPVFGGHV